MFGDTVRDIVTNLRGTLEMLENVASQLQTPNTKRADQGMNGKVLVFRFKRQQLIMWDH